MLRLYSYFRSSASWRVRTALHIKGLSYEYVPVHLLKNGGEQHRPEYRAINPLETVPLLEISGNPPIRLGESLAILRFIDEKWPNPPLLPADPVMRAQAWWIAEIINSGIHPLQNLSTLQALEQMFGASKEARMAWAARFLEKGLRAVETLLQQTSGTCCVGNEVTVADLCLVPQVYNGRRFSAPLEGFPTLLRIAGYLETLPAFVAAHPSKQPDAEPTTARDASSTGSQEG
jgi:maleylpyruvate isomerase